MLSAQAACSVGFCLLAQASSPAPESPVMQFTITGAALVILANFVLVISDRITTARRKKANGCDSMRPGDANACKDHSLAIARIEERLRSIEQRLDRK